MAVKIIKNNDIPSIPKFIDHKKLKNVKNWKLPFSGLNLTNKFTAANKLNNVVYKPTYFEYIPFFPDGKIKIIIKPNIGIINNHNMTFENNDKTVSRPIELL